MRHLPAIVVAVGLVAFGASSSAETVAAAPAASLSSGVLQVTITNITRGQTFTPIIVASHDPGVRLFELGQSASAELIAIAEFGDIAPLSMLLGSDPRVHDIADSGGLLLPGESVTIEVARVGANTQVSLAAMLLPTNDGFIALNGVSGPAGGRMVSYRVPGYDAGSEVNDESCDSIPGPMMMFPGPECGMGGSPGNGEGYVHMHAGIHGIGDLAPDQRDWRNSVAAVTIRRLP